MNLAEFYITNGGTGIEDTVDLLEIKNGFCLDGYTPGKLQLKNGGIFADSPIADGRTMVDYSWATIVDGLEFRMVAKDTDTMSYASQIFDRLLIQAINFGAKKKGNRPVYLIRRAEGERRKSYAMIIAFRLPNDSDFYQQSFTSAVNKLRVTDILSMSIEHGAWLEAPPGQFVEAEAGAYECFNVVLNSHFESFSGGNFTSWTHTGLNPLSQVRDFVEEGFYAARIEATGGSETLRQDVSQELLLDTYTYTVSCRVYLEEGTFTLRLSDYGAGTNAVTTSTSEPGWHTLEATKTLVTDGLRIILQITGAGDGIAKISWVTLCHNSGNVDSSGEDEPVITRDVYFDNQCVETGLTHIYDNFVGTWTSNWIPAGVPFDLHGTAVGQAIYFGATLTDESSQFNNIVLNLGQIAAGATSYTITWEYWNGAWVTLSVRDNTAQFSELGVNSVNWELPSDWTTGSLAVIVDPTAPAVTGYWVRARLSALVGAFTQVAEQVDRIPYAAIKNYLEVKQDQAIGTIPALMEAILENVSDDSTAFPSSDGASVRTIVGLRSGTPYFRGMINLSDRQNPPWISVAFSGVTTIANDAKAPSGRAGFYNPPAGTGILAAQATITIARSVIEDFFGEFLLFLRIDGTGGIPVEVQVVPSTGTETSVVYVSNPASQDMHTINLGNIRIPAAYPVENDSYDDIELVISLRPTAATSFNLIDLWLVPIDEILIDAINKDIIQINGEIAAGEFTYITIDSVNDVRRNIRSNLKMVDGDYIVTSWRTISGGPLILQPKQTQRYWFYQFYNYGGTPAQAYGRPEIANRGEVNRNARYTGMRGNDG